MRGKHFARRISVPEEKMFLEALADAYKLRKQAERLKDQLTRVTLEHAREMRKLRQDYENVVAYTHSLAGQLAAAQAEQFLKGETP